MSTKVYSASEVTKNNQNMARFAFQLKQQQAVNAGTSILKEQSGTVTQKNVVERIQGGVAYYANVEPNEPKGQDVDIDNDGGDES